MVPWRFVAVIIGLIFLLVFVGFNLENTAQIRFWFGESGEFSSNVIFVLFGSFLLGVFVTLPFIFKRRIQYYDISKEKKKKKSGNEKNKKDVVNDGSNSSTI